MEFRHHLAAFIGAFVGDASSVRLTSRHEKTQYEVTKAMRMEGGGFAPGQFAVVGELHIVLANILSNCDPKSGMYPTDAVAHAYNNWFKTTNYLGIVDCESYRVFGNTWPSMYSGKSLSEDMRTHAACINIRSKTYGALLRALPIALWAVNCSDDMIAYCASEDARLTHPNVTCQTVNAAFCIAVAHLIRTKGDVVGMISKVENYVLKVGTANVYKWMQKAVCLESLPEVPQDEHDHIKWPFIYAMWHVLHESSFETALRTTLTKCKSYTSIVCSLVAACKGIQYTHESIVQVNSAYVDGVSDGMYNTVTNASPHNALGMMRNSNIIPVFHMLINATK